MIVAADKKVKEIELSSNTPWLAVVIPTFNERDNIQPMIARLAAALDSISWEAIFVDDNSTDGTLEALEAVNRQHPNVRGISRIGRRGLSSAVVEGMQSTFAPFIAVMDADMQHDEKLLPEMLSLLVNDECDLVVGSRYVALGGLGDWDDSRVKISKFATSLAGLVLKNRPLTDPMSGFFAMRRDVFRSIAPKLSEQGYKILLDIVASAPLNLRIKEVPYVFASRTAGESKLDSVAVIDYLLLLLDKIIGGWLPTRFFLFAGVGSIGLVVHFLVLGLIFATTGNFIAGQIFGTIVAMTTNFFLNNLLTYRDKRLKGTRRIIFGLLSFYAVCSIGAVGNVGVANFIFGQHYSWWVAGACGVLIGIVWNYAASSVTTWRS